MSETTAASSPSSSRYTIAHATDLDPDGGIAFEHAVALTCETDGVLYSMHAAPEGGEASEADDPSRAMPDAAELLKRWTVAGRPMSSKAAEDFDYNPVVHTCCVDPVDTLLDGLRGVDPDLLVVGKHHTSGIWKYLHDSVAESLALNAGKPTLFVPIGGRGFVESADGRLSLHRVLIPVADEAAMLPAFQVVAELAERLGARDLEVLFLHVGDRRMDDLMVPETAVGLDWEVINAEGPIDQAILEAGSRWNADLVAMATRGHDSLTDVLRGSNTERVARMTECPLLSVPAGRED